MGEEVKRHLNLYRGYIEKIIRPTYVLGYMADWFQEDAIEQIKHEEQKGPTAAAALFFDKLISLEAEGWYQGFLDGLYATGYTGLYIALQKLDFTDIDDLDEAKKHLSIIQSTVKNNINPEEIVGYFHECLMDREIEEILQETNLKGHTAGAERFIDCLLRSDKKQWPKVFTLALEEKDCTPVLEVWTIEKELNDKVKTDKSKEEQEELSAFNFVQYAEDPEPTKPCFSASVGLVHDNRTTAVPEMNRIFPGDTHELHPIMTPRKYQEELARPAYSGKNTIICAPTGSGKTLVALSISEHHLRSQPEGHRGKVVFMATKLPVYEQQRDVFCKHFEGTGYKVAGFCGESPENLPIGLMIKDSDIIVLTPQILVNCLQNGCVPSLSIFSLIIFDECHNTTGSHPYNVLMFAYLDMKLDSPKEKRPQIIGLTASVGTGKSRCLDEATSYVLKLCASLDVEVISTVKENLEELKNYVYTPKKLIRETDRRQKDPFYEIMAGIMAETEKMAKSVFPDLDSLSNIQKRTYGTQKYEQWITDTQKKCRILQMENKMEETRICKALFTYTEHLRKYNDSLIINEDARTKDALDYLNNFFENVKNGSYNQIEQLLTRNFEAKLPSLENISADNLNPKLDEVQFILSEAYHENPQTRTLLFVKTRALVSALKKWIEETPTLSFLKPEVLIGRNKRNESIGMTLPNLKGALETFKSSGESKLLIATSVADEGIDIPACNLVLLYEYVGNVTKMIQVRGRGRAKDSKCILVTCKRDEAEKERNNLLHETLMNDAVVRLQELDNNDFLLKIQRIQKDEKTQRDFRRDLKSLPLSDENKRLLCGKCKRFVCNTDDIRVINDSHHTVIDNKFKDRYTTKPHPKPRGFSGYTKKFKIFCCNEECKEDWGVSGTYQTFQNIPLIKIEKFVVESKNGNQECFNKWVKVDFKMKQFRIEEISESLSAVLQ